jgi:uncharacterized protein YndB with AHSA1/START domain
LAPQTQPARRKVVLEHTFNAAIEEVWELWTTKEGIESWWGPEGFAVKVRKLEVRPGGELAYAMTATAPEQIEFLKKAGMPITQEARVTYTDVVRPTRLAFRQMADFIPNVKPYELAMKIDFDTSPQGVRMVLTLDAMHDEQWTRLAVMGWESELGKLAKLLKSG